MNLLKTPPFFLFILICPLFSFGGVGHLVGSSVVSGVRSASLPDVVLNKSEENKLISFIAKKEFGGDWSKSVDWNAGEDFPSLGLGHYLWFPEGSTSPFNESFPDFIRFAYEKNKTEGLGLSFPQILKLSDDGSIAPAPWKNRNEFLKSKGSSSFQELIDFISSEKVKKLQLEYQISHARNFALKALNYEGEAGDSALKSNPESRQALLSELLRNPEGVALLIHYPTFKGDGFSAKERYSHGGKNKGWGLFQVLDRAASLSDDDSRVIDYRQNYSAKTSSIAKIRVAAEEILKERALNDKTTLSVGSSTRASYIKSWNSALSVYGNILR